MTVDQNWVFVTDLKNNPNLENGIFLLKYLMFLIAWTSENFCIFFSFSKKLFGWKIWSYNHFVIIQTFTIYQYRFLRKMKSVWRDIHSKILYNYLAYVLTGKEKNTIFEVTHWYLSRKWILPPLLLISSRPIFLTPAGGFPSQLT